LGFTEKIDEVLSDTYQIEARFMSHITLARVKHVSSKKELIEYLKSVKSKDISFEVDKFFLKKSELKLEGPVYTDIENYDFSKN
jgi:2'-5' RNA ligase